MRSGERADLLERESELVRIEAAIEGACAGEGETVLIEGPAGIGKTALLRAATELSRERACVLAARATELEREFPFGAVRQLLEPTLRSVSTERRAELLDGAAAHAAPTLGLGEGAAAPGDSGFATLNGLFWLVANLAEDEPLLLCLDDAHWADHDSLRFLAFLAPRVAELPVLLLLAARPGEWRPEAWFAATASDPAARAMAPEPLSERASAAIVAARFERDPHPGFARACHLVTGGNPFYLHALLDELHRDRAAPTEEAAERVLRLGPLAVSQAIVARLALLSASAAPLARAIAVLGDDVDLEHAARLAGLEPADARAVAEELAEAAILEPSPSLRLAHPIIRNSVYQDIGHRERVELHGRAVEILAGDETAAERIPGHLLAVEPAGEPAVAATLRRAAADALARGATDSAVAYLRRALAEPPPDSDRAAVLLELGQAELQLAHPDAVAHLEGARTAAWDPADRQAALGGLSFSRYLGGDAAGAAAAAHDAIEQISPGAGGEPEAQLLLTCGLVGRVVPELVDQARARLEPSRTGPDGELTPAELVRLGLWAFDAFLRGERRLATDRLRLAGDCPTQVRVAGSVPALAGNGLFHSLLGQDREAEKALDHALEDGRRRGSRLHIGVALDGRTHLRWMSGDLAGAIADAETVLRLNEGEWDPATTVSRVVRSLCLLERGDTAAAASALEILPALEARLPGTFGWLWAPYGRARVALARGEWAKARDQALVCGERLLAIQAPSPDYLPWRSLAAQALVRLDEGDRALEHARDEVELGRASGSERATGVALATLGVLVGGDEGGEALHEAIELLAGTSGRLEHARALVDLGAAIRRSGRRAEAREQLGEGMALARECGAIPLAERAYTELRAAGARPRKPMRAGIDELTPSELRVARMAAEGQGNREIAQRLFVTVKTVEFHLGQVYRKLEISARRELGEALGE